MALYITIFILAICVSILSTWLVVSKQYNNKITELKEENIILKNKADINNNLSNELKVLFTDIANTSLKSQQESLISQHSNELKNKFDLFKAEELAPINKLLTEFKQSIDKYQESHSIESQDIKNAIITAEKYAKALTLSQATRGACSENQLEQILKFANLKENIHYTKQYVSKEDIKPDFVINLPNDRHIIIDSKAILKNYLEYCENNDNDSKKRFITDIEDCIVDLAKKNYEEIDELNQPDFILMYMPLENCINELYTNNDFNRIITLANQRNIIIVGSASLLISLRLVNQLWASQKQYNNVENIIKVAENLYNSIAIHSKSLLNIQEKIEDLCQNIKTEINRFSENKKDSIFKEAEKLRNYGISIKEQKSGKKLIENSIQQEFLQDEDKQDLG